MGALHTVLCMAVAALSVAPHLEAKVKRLVSTKCSPAGGSIYKYFGQDIWTQKDIPFSTYQGKQEPGKNASEIMNGIRYVRPGHNFQPNFQMFSKIKVNGPEEHPLYTFLKRFCPATRDGFEEKHSLMYEPLMVTDVRWNFEKVLVDRSGRPVFRYDGSTHPETIDLDIQNLMKNNLTSLVSEITL